MNLGKFLIKKKDADLVHIDDFRTSKRCYKCGSETFKNRMVLNRNGKIYESNGILCCKNSNENCGTTIDCDLNASKNILHIFI